MYTIEKQRFGPVFSWSVLSSRRIKQLFFFFVFVFKFIVHVLTTLCHPLTSFQYTQEKVKNESCENASFCSCTNKKAVAENVYEVNQELGLWGIVFFCVPGSSLRGSPLPLSTPATQASPGVGTSKKEKNCPSQRGTVTSEIEPRLSKRMRGLLVASLNWTMH